MKRVRVLGSAVLNTLYFSELPTTTNCKKEAGLRFQRVRSCRLRFITYLQVGLVLHLLKPKLQRHFLLHSSILGSSAFCRAPQQSFLKRSLLDARKRHPQVCPSPCTTRTPFRQLAPLMTRAVKSSKRNLTETETKIYNHAKESLNTC